VRVALVTNLLPPHGTGGAERYARDVADELARRHDVLVLSGTPGATVRAPVITLPGLPHLAPDTAVAAKAVWHLRDQWSNGVRKAARAQLAAFEPDVVFTHEVQGLSASVFGAIADGGFAHVHMTHDFNLLCARVTMTVDGDPCGGGCAGCRLQRAVRLRALLGRVDLVVSPSETVRRRHQLFGVPTAKLRTIRHGVVPGRSAVHRQNPVPTVGFIGALGPHKGVPTLLRALQASAGDWRLRIAGVGRLEETVQASAAADPHLDYVGYVDGAAKEAFFESVDVLAVPSECEEVAPLVVLEAAIRQVPVVASDRGGLPEGPVAAVFRAGDDQALATALTDVACDPVRLTRERAALGERVGEFSWDRHTREIEDVLLEAGSRS
jgi:glycosyltransferase involved in cell wall biosynthesis